MTKPSIRRGAWVVILATLLGCIDPQPRSIAEAERPVRIERVQAELADLRSQFEAENAKAESIVAEIDALVSDTSLTPAEWSARAAELEAELKVGIAEVALIEARLEALDVPLEGQQVNDE